MSEHWQYMLTGLFHYFTVNVIPARTGILKSKYNLTQFLLRDRNQTYSFRVRICNVRSWIYITTKDFTCQFGSNTWIKFIKSFNYCLFVTCNFIVNDKCMNVPWTLFLLITSLTKFQDFFHFHMIQIFHHSNLFQFFLIIYLILFCIPCIYWHYILSGVSGKSHKVCF